MIEGSKLFILFVTIECSLRILWDKLM